ncbi:MAG: hypothetical protein Q9227_008803 [Pyrenula ochraceoflavens]
MPFDHLAEERQERNFTLWVQMLLRTSPERLAMQLAEKHRAGKVSAARQWRNGALNVCYRVKYEDGFHAVVRFAALGRAIFRNEKVNNELAVMQYLAEHTSIPVPRVFGSGCSWTGPYIVMEFIEGDGLDKFLKDPSQDGRPVLNPNISSRALERAYREMAGLVLELARPEFVSIGALERKGAGIFSASKRPLTFNMNELAVSANIPQNQFSDQAFGSATDYWMSLANQHLSHLRYQRNDLVIDEEDCRKKYVARCLFRKIVKDISYEHRHGPFHLYCDDFRPSNVLIDVQKLCVTGVIDWEFTYVAPAEFSYVAPWWLLLQSPEDWESDLNDFLARYNPRLQLFLEALRKCESEKQVGDSQRLSTRMERSMENGLFWICLAARYSSMFDEIYWTFIDKMYHGSFTTLEERVELLDNEDRSTMDIFVQEKMAQETGILDDYYSTDAMVDL